MLKYAFIAIAIIIIIWLIFKVHEIYVIMKYNLDEDDMNGIFSDDPEKIEKIKNKVCSIIDSKNESLEETQNSNNSNDDTDYSLVSIYSVSSYESAQTRLNNHQFINNSYIIISNPPLNVLDLKENNDYLIIEVISEIDNTETITYFASKDKENFSEIKIMKVSENKLIPIENNVYAKVFIEYAKRNHIDICNPE